ncbi:MAG: hypothetical protein IT340_18050 [Chloroflexi bacterium]|nr:hypothetical protein [Chloroflexota bacterium]
MPVAQFVPFSMLARSLADIPFLPLDQLIPQTGEASILDQFGLTSATAAEIGNTVTYQVNLATLNEVVFELPGLSGFAVVVGLGNIFTEFQFELDIALADGSFQEARVTGGLGLRFPREMLRPMRHTADGIGWEPVPDAHREFAITATLHIDANFDITFSGPTVFTLQPTMIGDTGVIVEAANIVPILSATAPLPAGVPAGAVPAGFRGVYIGNAGIHLADPGVPITGVSLNNALIGSSGFSGDVAVDLNLTGSLLGFEFRLTHFGLDFVQNSLTGSDIRGAITVPFFEGPLAVSMAINADGTFAASLAGAGLLVRLEKQGLLAFELEAVSVGNRGGVAELGLSGRLALDFAPDLDLPTFSVQDLTINSRGEVTIQGGWIDLGDALGFSLYGFSMELSRIGFGSDGDGASQRNWVGLSGSVRLVDGLAIGGSVDGMRISWNANATSAADLDVGLTVEGIGVELTIPNVLEFTGYVRFINDAANGIQGFAGDISLSLPTINFNGSASILVGKQGAMTFFYIAVSADLPFGIPLAQTGVAFYGFQGLLGFNVYPNKTAEEHWYEDWYLTPQPGVTQAMKWYPPKADAFAIGLGATLGTFPDNGYTVSGKVLIVLVIPGPILMIEGRANFLAARADLNSLDPAKPPLRALLVLDGNDGTFLLNIGAQYEIDALIKIAATAEAFFDFNDPLAFHFNLGVDQPRNKRIRAEILGFLLTEAYFMLNSSDLRFGAWVGYDERWDFGPLSVVLAAWMEGGVILGWSPVQMAGYLEVHGEVRLRAFGIGIGISVNARLEAEAPKPFRVRGEFEVELELPWPLPDVGVTVELEWIGPQDPPDFPAVIKSIDLEHQLTGGTWRGLEGAVSAAIPAGTYVPVDARPVIAFARPVEDTVPFGSNAASTTPYRREQAGNHEFGHRLVNVSAEDITGSPTPFVPLSGLWRAELTADGAKAAKLELWGRSPFSYNGTTSTSYAETMMTMLPTYPCGEQIVVEYSCVDFSDLQDQSSITGTTNLHGLKIVLGPRDRVFVDHTPPVAPPQSPSLLLNSVYTFRIALAGPVSRVVLLFSTFGRMEVTALAGGNAVDSREIDGNDPRPVEVELRGANIDELAFRGNETYLHHLCTEIADRSDALSMEQQRLRTVTAQSVEQWYSEEEIFTPNRTYRLRVQTESTRYNPDGSTDVRLENAELTFRTGGAPALTPAVTWAEPDTGNAGAGNPYRSLASYVSRTVPIDGERPVYRAYDVGVEFTKNYVESLYTGDVRIRLFAPGDREVSPAGGLGNQWGRNRTLMLSQSEELWLQTLTTMNCVPVNVDANRIVTNTTLSASSPGLALEPELRHDARLFAFGVEAYAFSFITSRYLGFREHFDSFDGRVWRLETTAAPVDAAMQTLVATARTGGASFDPAEPGAFDTLYYDLFGLPARRLPDAVEWSEISSPAGRHALLLESPEPIAWVRVTTDAAIRETFHTLPGRSTRALPLIPTAGTATLLRESLPGAVLDRIRAIVSYRAVETVWIRNIDGTRALVFFPNGTQAAGPLPMGMIRVHYTFARNVPGGQLPILRRAGSDAPENATHFVKLPALA